MRLLLILPAILAVVACGRREAVVQPNPSAAAAEAALRAVNDGGTLPGDLHLEYSDEHGMWGGTRVTVDGTGAYRWQHSDQQQGTRVASGQVSEEQVRDLVRLLVSIRAWEQAAFNRLAVPDESTARVIIRAGGTESRTWEWHRDLADNGRLILVRDRMAGLRSGFPVRDPFAPPPPPPATNR
jgi:hypothetical protein